MGKKVTSSDIAKLAHVSQSTVSRALNPDHAWQISPKKRMEILSLCRQHGYIGGRSSSPRTFKVGLLMGRMEADPSVLTAYKLYKLRNGINGRAHRDDSLWLYSAHNISHIPQYHSLSHYMPLKLFKTHPEYFSMDPQGKRFRPRSFSREGSLCMSNPEVAKVALESLRKMIKKDRETLPRDKWPHVYDISTLDNSPYICKCPECSAITKEEGSETGLLLRFINFIAREIRKEYPDIIIRTFGYSSTVNPPTKTMPADNVLIRLADKFTVSDPFRPLTDPINADRIPYFREWRKGAKRLMVWDCWNLGYKGYYRPPRPDTVFNAIQSDLRFFRDLGVTELVASTGMEIAR